MYIKKEGGTWLLLNIIEKLGVIVAAVIIVSLSTLVTLSEKQKYDTILSVSKSMLYFIISISCFGVLYYFKS